ncbi:MAG TPA: carbon starvation CstA family protein [Planctomycetota bacterium]|jgi:carbon starvation protein|nr:carbon starvation CstA family protein [Planctomycetota bacterium]
MNVALIVFAALAVLALGYFTYGRLVARLLGLDPSRLTPAYTRRDGVDFVPTPPFYLLGQHFSAIAAAGPIAGPILACQQFGWLPCVLWIVFGAILVGAVHDFSSLLASVRHRGGSVVEIVKARMGKRASIAFLAFIWISLLYVIVAFADITANTFVGRSEEVEFAGARFDPGGAVAGSSAMYLGLAVVMGLVLRLLRPRLLVATALFVPATLFVVWLGTQVSTAFVLPVANPARVWGLLILAYCFVASLAPVWSLLQPRGYLGGFVLYAALAIGVLGVLLGGFPARQAAFTGWTVHPPGGAAVPLFPMLFVTIACGACSGFHGLVCSGTTSKQVDRETHCRPVGYGGMLLEGFVALLALATIVVAAPGSTSGLAPGTIYGNGLGGFLTVLIGEEHRRFAATFGAMAFSTFVFDTLDVGTRLGRYLVQELLGWRSPVSRVAATALTLLLPAAILATAEPGAYRNFWTLFGTSNQLLASLTLLGVSVWLARTRRPFLFALLPMAFVFAVTATSLVVQAWTAGTAIAAGSATATVAANGVVALLLLSLAVFLLVEGLLAIADARSVRTAEGAAAT